MYWIDFVIIVLYLTGVFLVGAYFFKKNKNREDYYVGGRSIKPFHVGLSVVATDVGGGFSIGLGALGYTIGLSGSWMLFTGLVGAWLSAVLIIPKLKLVDKKHGMMTYPDFLRFRFNKEVAWVAAMVSGIGYLGFTGGQVLAGAKLASATLFTNIPLAIDPLTFSVIVIAGVILLYTVLGGIQAVIYTDTVQWIILLSGLIFVAMPLTYFEVGGFEGLDKKLPDGFLTLTNVTWEQIVNWSVTILPIWLIGMTLYQRMYACKDLKDAKKAWYIAGIFEYPIMAFVGVSLGMASRVFFPELDDPDLGLPKLLKEVLPIGAQGLVIAAYFSAIMSTADSCLLASSGNFVNDFIERAIKRKLSHKAVVRISQGVTLLIGITAIAIAMTSEAVLNVILDAYSFMVASLTVPTLAAYFSKKSYPNSAMAAIIAGGATAGILIWQKIEFMGLAQSFWGLLVSAAAFLIYSAFEKPKNK